MSDELANAMKEITLLRLALADEERKAELAEQRVIELEHQLREAKAARG
jgi:hypothetical protein